MANEGQYDSQTNIEIEDYEKEILAEREFAKIYNVVAGVSSVNGYTGDVILTTSDLENTSDYQTGTEVQSAIDTAISGKQDVLTAGNNISISGNTISAVDTTYTAGTGLDLSGTTFSADTTVLATKAELATVATSGNYNDLVDKPTIPDVSNFITNTVDDLVNYYKKSETFTKQEVNNLISAISTMSLEVVQTLPTEDISTTTIYLVPKQTAEQNDAYDEYIYVSNAWEHIGSTEVDLTNYVTNTDYATSSTGGVIKVSSGNGLAISQQGVLYGAGRTYQQYVENGGNLLISKSTLETVFTGKGMLPIVTLTQQEYDALVTKDSNTYYYIVEE